MGTQHGATPQSRAEQLVECFGRLHVFDDLLRVRAADATQHPILAYPRSENDAGSYEYFTGQDLDGMVDQVVRALIDRGFCPPRYEHGSVVALFTPSDLNMVLTFFALSRLGYTVMMLSPRLSAAACVALLDRVRCDTILYGRSPSIRKTVGEVLKSKIVSCQPMIQRSSLEQTDESPSVMILNRDRHRNAEVNKVALILHSSGSTGLPKPILLSHKALLTHAPRGSGFTSFNPLPWFHLHGLSTALQAMYMRRTAFMWNASLPLTASGLVVALEEARPETIQAVPYVLQLLSDDRRGLDILRNCRLVSFGGAACPDELGDRLVKEGVRLGGTFGLTEAGLVAESISRPKDDPYWDYLRFFDNLAPFTWMKPISDSLFECVYLSGHPALTTSNSDEPAGSFYSRDAFKPHPSIPDRWKYVARLDDRVTLVNGEKVLPLPIEGTIKQSPLIDEAVVVGAGKAVPGLLIFRSEESKHLPIEEYRDAIWPNIQSANVKAEKFSQISREMVTIMPSTSRCPRTDKDSIIRAQVYMEYASVIEDMYTNFERTADGTMQLDIFATQAHIMKLCQEELALSVSSADAKFFVAGVDSLKAIHLRRLLLRDFKFTDSNAISQNVVYETGTIARLAEHICAVQSGRQAKVDDEISLMSALIEKYSSFDQHSPTSARGTRKSVILTGPTGSIGAHTLLALLNDSTISTIYCLTRRPNPHAAIMQTFTQKSLPIPPPSQVQKISALTTILHKPNLGLDESTLSQMQDSVTLIIHAAWPVNFNIPLSVFEEHIKGLHSLIQFSSSVKQPVPATLLFCSSVSTALSSFTNKIPEIPLSNFHSALKIGYARSKLVGEHIVSNARRSVGAKAFSLRIGQVSGHSRHGLWNDDEAAPAMVRSAVTLKVLPDLDMACDWTPVDKLAAAVVEIAGACAKNEYALPPSSHSNTSSKDDSSNNDDDNGDEEDDSLYNLTNPNPPFPWHAVLTTLHTHGLPFDTVPVGTWLSKLRESAARGEERVNPAVKLVEYYEDAFGDASNEKWEGKGEKEFVTARAERDSPTLRGASGGGMRIVEDGVLGVYVRDWVGRWCV